jgi:hypothetical protein
VTEIIRIPNESERVMSWLNYLADRQVVAIGIPALGIVLAALLTLLRSSMSHRERMAMIERGLHPDDPRDRRAVPAEEVPV